MGANGAARPAQLGPCTRGGRSTKHACVCPPCALQKKLPPEAEALLSPEELHLYTYGPKSRQVGQLLQAGPSLPSAGQEGQLLAGVARHAWVSHAGVASSAPMRQARA